jgi:hypothetical protein
VSQNQSEVFVEIKRSRRSITFRSGLIRLTDFVSQNQNTEDSFYIHVSRRFTSFRSGLIRLTDFVAQNQNTEDSFYVHVSRRFTSFRSGLIRLTDFVSQNQSLIKMKSDVLTNHTSLFANQNKENHLVNDEAREPPLIYLAIYRAVVFL